MNLNSLNPSVHVIKKKKRSDIKENWIWSHWYSYYLLKHFWSKLREKQLSQTYFNHFFKRTFIKDHTLNIWFKDLLATKPMYLHIYVTPPPLPPSKQKLVNSYSSFKSLLWGIFVYNVEKSDVVIDSNFLCLFKFLILVITASLFKTLQMYSQQRNHTICCYSFEHHNALL